MQIVFRHALLGESLEPVGSARGLSTEEAITSDLFRRAGVVDLVELVPTAELATERIPQQFPKLHAVFGRIAVRSSEILVEIRPDVGVVEIAREIGRAS